MSSKPLGMIAVRQQRRGTAVSHRKSVVDEIITVYPPTERLSIGSGDSGKRSSWIEKVRTRSVVLTSKGQIILETRFPTDLRGIFSIRFAPDGDKFVTAYGIGVMQVWHAETDNHCITIKSAPEHGDAITSIRFLRNSTNSNKFFAAGVAGILFLCGMNAGDYKEFAREPGNEINALDVDLDGENVVTAGKDAVLRLYDINTQKIKLKLCRGEGLLNDEDIAKFHRMRVFAVRFHPDHKDIFLSGGWDDCIKIWDTRVKNGNIREFRGPHLCGDALDVQVNNNEEGDALQDNGTNFILTGSWKVENSLQLWDFTSGKLINTIIPVNRPRNIDGEFLYCCQFFAGDPTGNTVVCGGSGLSCVEAIDIQENKVTSYFKIHKSIQAIDTTSRFMAFGGMETVFKVALIS